jgi:GAF domain-containing protein
MGSQGKDRPMRRGTKPAKAKVEAKPRAARNLRKDERIGDLEKRLAEALDQQTATAEILHVISSSPTDVQPVFRAILDSAVRLSRGLFGVIYRWDGTTIHVEAFVPDTPERRAMFEQHFPAPASHDTIVGQVILTGALRHVPDIETGAPSGTFGRAYGVRSLLAIPLLRDGQVTGVIGLARREAEPFSEHQISLLQTFADQAVIAIENVRLFNETKETLEQQRGTSEILEVISSSPTHVQPVFDTIARCAVRLCRGFFCTVSSFDGELIHLVAHSNLSATMLEIFQRTFPRPPGSTTVVGRSILEQRVVHVPDIQADLTMPVSSAISQVVGYRSVVAVPMLREGHSIGVIAVARVEAEPFSDGEIALLKTFADQAVIAIQNVRLFTELQARNTQLTEALERETATSEILRVISSSPTELQPVLDAVARSATRVCAAYDAVIRQVDGDVLRFAAHYGPIPSPPGYAIPVTRGRVAGRAVLDRQPVQVADAQAESEEFLPEARTIARERGFRTILSVPLLREGVGIGTIDLRRTTVLPFTETQTTLLQTFADQAVIAIENVRLFTELQEKNRALTKAHSQVSETLERQTATSEILRVIASSPTDLQPVFTAIAESAKRLLGGFSGSITRLIDDALHLGALTSTNPTGDDAARAMFPVPLTSGVGIHTHAARTRAPFFVVDVETDPRVSDPRVREMARAREWRSFLAVPMLRGEQVLGTIGVSRREPGAFKEEELALLQTFADQAVIAIENVRLFKELETRNRELTEALEQQTATAEILRAITSSPTDLEPVLEAVARNAARLCEVDDLAIIRADGDTFTIMFSLGPDNAFRGRQLSMAVRSATSQAIREGRTVHIPDTLASPDYEVRPEFQAYGWRTALAVPLMREEVVIGAITARRPEVKPFSNTQITLLETFADQAVIAIENVRLFKELQARNRDLTEALDRQTATAEILRVISQSQTEVQPVFDAIVRSAPRLCEATFAALHRFDGQMLSFDAQHGMTEAEVEETHRRFPHAPTRETAVGRAILARQVAHIHDIRIDPEYRVTAGQMTFHTVLAVPLLREGNPIGVMGLWRREVRPFTDGQIELVKTFADQAVIAIENVRLFKELEARTADLTRSVDQLTALGEVGRAVSSTLDVETVLTTIVARAIELSGLDGGVVLEYDEPHQEFVHRAQAETGGALAGVRRATRIRKGEGVVGRTAITLEPVQVSDITAPGAYVSPNRENLIQSGVRAILAVPMVREGQLIGCLGVTRNQPGDFPTETIELLRTFATQSALAIQNAQLFQEIADKSRQLEAASRHKSEFLANMSHELRTPLNAIIGFAEVLTERMFGELNEKQDEYLKDIYASGQHLLSLINDILDLSKIEAGRMELELTDFDLPQAISNALTLVRGRAARRDIALHQAVDQRLGQIRGDERKIKQVLLNLLSNALKFTPEGGRVDVLASVVDGMAEVAVTDTGVGIAPEDQEAVFEEFRQVGTADKKVEGTGLGLTLSRKFIELHGGKIWVKSQVGMGSTFTFTLPLTV